MQSGFPIPVNQTMGIIGDQQQLILCDFWYLAKPILLQENILPMNEGQNTNAYRFTF